LAEIGEADVFGDHLLADLAGLNAYTYLPDCWGLSVGAHVAEDMVMPYEISIVHAPAFEDEVLGVGREAIKVWQLLTERRIVADR
jgi:hypothetical protein